MLFTDGGEDRAQDVFMQYNWPNKTVSFSCKSDTSPLPPAFEQDVSVVSNHTMTVKLTFPLFTHVRFEYLPFPWASITMMSHPYNGLRAPIKVSSASYTVDYKRIQSMVLKTVLI